MGFFSDIFKVKVDEERHLIRFSARVSEKAVFEYWLSPSTLIPFIKASDFSVWRGSDAFKAKATGRDAILGIKTSEGMTYFKMSDSHLGVMRAQVEAACEELGVVEAGDGAITVSSLVTLDVLHQMQLNLKSSVEDLIKKQFEDFTGAIVGALENKLQSIGGVPQSAPPPNRSEVRDEPMFIPSNLVPGDVVGEAHVNKTSSKDDISDAVAALKKLKNTRRK
jgi:hypothetical protein